ncbi:Ribonuclease J 1 [Rhodobacteraceae bacterium THAF1]|uniref:ribonuclease J n=1 Tax=Palleronia sp. THAF1 TaxID=2587842 RepID=UPI000F3B7396|nr:ribonuclease J [Palleronia sp. THAF1]QFU08366.1 Ribonuclease J 1 [Palleronia sp. THAF1]VDC29067.1 Ribonuclease J 1 [Rhodobacteraceae bacterium THAF1]
MATERLIYLPLGGAGEIGMNCYVYGYGAPGKERLIVVDLGVTFPDMDTTPGVDLIYPDITWLAERKDRIEAIFITHAHEDHVGAVGMTYGQLEAPIYARNFTAIHARRKMEEHGHDPAKVNVVAPWPEQVNVGPFTVGFLPISHSIPESSAMVIDTKEGRVIHTGDFKIDYAPGVGEAFDRDLWAEVAKDGVKALICDSTNVFNTHEGRSESSVGPEITRFIAEQKGMVAATTFASNVARVRTLAMAGVEAGRTVCLMGRSMKRMIDASQEAGVLPDFPPFIQPEQAGDIPRENLMLIVTGSQGERRAASAQLARGKFLGISMDEGDTFLFSSRTIPGNERGVIDIWNQLSERGVDVQDDDNGRYHVSGHANRPDLVVMHELTKPQMVIPMHGEHRHLREHAKLAESMGRTGVVAPNGTCVSLSGNKPETVEYVDTGRTYLDGSVKIGAMDGVVRDRIRMALNGHMIVSLLVDEDDAPLGEPWVDLKGLPETNEMGESVSDIVEHDLDQAVRRAGDNVLRDDKKLDELLRRAARNSANSVLGRKPEVTVVVSRLS